MHAFQPSQIRKVWMYCVLHLKTLIIVKTFIHIARNHIKLTYLHLKTKNCISTTFSTIISLSMLLKISTYISFTVTARHSHRCDYAVLLLRFCWFRCCCWWPNCIDRAAYANLTSKICRLNQSAQKTHTKTQFTKSSLFCTPNTLSIFR